MHVHYYFYFTWYIFCDRKPLISRKISGWYLCQRARPIRVQWQCVVESLTRFTIISARLPNLLRKCRKEYFKLIAQSLMLSGDKACFLVVFCFVFTVSSYPSKWSVWRCIRREGFRWILFLCIDTNHHTHFWVMFVKCFISDIMLKLYFKKK